MNPAVDSFVQEAREILDDLETVLLELEAEPGNADTVDAVFRALHTLKGSGAMFGFTALADFTHHFENAYDRIRDGKAQVTRELIQLSLSSCDHLARLIAAGPGEHDATPAEDAATRDLVARIEALAEAAPAAAAPAALRDAAPRRYAIGFKPDAAAMRHGTRPDLLLAELAGLGETRVTCHADAVPPLRDLDPCICYLAWQIELTTTAGRDAIEEIFIFASDCEVEITTLDEREPMETAATKAEPGEPAEKTATAKSDSVRVQSHRLDALMDQLGELVIAQARLNRLSADIGDTALAGTAEEIERLVTGLRDATLSIRMLPIELVFGKFRRVVRDLSGELGKSVRLETRGGETEVDKNVIDSLTEPLVDLIRNAIDHGVETPEGRRAAGKPEQARVLMRARQSGGEVLISITDDGAGLDADAIRSRAIERGLIQADQDLSDDQLYALIFEPGFSTAKTLSSVSGRGVGMDAVRRVIDDLRGSVDVRSERGRGTEVTLRLPLTLAIIDGLLVRIADGAFVLPLSCVEECVELPAEETDRQSGRSILRIRNDLVPFVSLDALFGFARVASDHRRVVVTSIDGQRMGLVVDEVVGQHQTVIKPLSVYHRGIDGLAGSTILGDGLVALILDAAALIKVANAAQRAAA